MEKISKAKINRYELLRLLYVSNKFYNDLRGMVSMKEKELLSALSYCLSQGLVKKTIVKVEVEPAEDSEIRMVADLLGIKPKDEKKVCQYHLTRKGIRKLAYLDFKYELFNHVTLPPFIGEDNRYFDEVNKIIEEKNCFNQHVDSYE